MSTAADDQMKQVPTDVVVVGGGQAGISLSYFLKTRGIEHVVLERDRPFASWVMRWDGFVANTPNWMNTLPMIPEPGFLSEDPDGFATRDEILQYLQSCLEVVVPPMVAGAEVVAVSYRGPWDWEVRTRESAYRARFVAVCTGAMSTPRVPEFAKDVPSHVPQMHSSEYRSPLQIETSRVLIVGSGSSGVQIARLLLESGRFDQVSLARSRVLVLPKRVLGMPTHRLIHMFGFFDVKVRSRFGRLMYSNLETRGDPIVPPTPRQLARRSGLTIFPRLIGWDEFGARFADGRQSGADDLTVIWCTGLRGDYSLIDVGGAPAFDEGGFPRHTRGIVLEAPGLCYVGLRYQHTVASHDIYGVGADAEFVAAHIGKVLSEKGARVA